MNRVIVYEDKQGIDHYFIEGKPYEPNEYPKEYMCKCVYASLTDAIKDSDCWQNDHCSDCECLDYVMDVIKQVENKL